MGDEDEVVIHVATEGDDEVVVVVVVVVVEQRREFREEREFQWSPLSLLNSPGSGTKSRSLETSWDLQSSSENCVRGG